jgi:hypothetical protein
MQILCMLITEILLGLQLVHVRVIRIITGISNKRYEI